MALEVGGDRSKDRSSQVGIGALVWRNILFQWVRSHKRNLIAKSLCAGAALDERILAKTKSNAA